MHIPDGFISAPVSVIGGVVAAGLIVVSVRKAAATLDDRQIPLAGLVAWVIIIEDFIGWLQGQRSLFGERFGDFETVIAPVKEKIEEFKTWFSSIPEAVSAAWKSAVEGMRPQVEWMISAVKLIMSAFEPLVRFFEGVFDKIIEKFQAFYDKVAFVVNGIRALLPSFAAATEGTGSGTDPEAQASRRRNMGARGALGGFPTVEELMARPPDVSGRLSGGAGGINAPQSNQITNQVTVNAPGSDPASVASGTQAGMARATDAMTTRLGSSLALGLGIANPRVEAAAQ